MINFSIKDASNCRESLNLARPGKICSQIHVSCLSTGIANLASYLQGRGNHVLSDSADSEPIDGLNDRELETLSQRRSSCRILLRSSHAVTQLSLLANLLAEAQSSDQQAGHSCQHCCTQATTLHCIPGSESANDIILEITPGTV